MFALIRLFLISLFIMLQFAAPLIHAHKNNGDVRLGSSIHLPEFEQVNAPFKHASEFTASTNNDEGIVAVSTGIQNEISPFEYTENNMIMLLLGLCFLAKKRGASCYFSHTEPIRKLYFLTSFSSRAPPFFTFR